MITDGKTNAPNRNRFDMDVFIKHLNEGKFSYAAALSFIVAIVLIFLAALQFKIMKSQNEGD
jgi:ABC-type sugar transport system permease subunit